MNAGAHLFVLGAGLILLAAPGSPCEVERLSVDSAGNPGNNDSGFPAISADGRVVALDSNASNLVTGDTNGTADIFVRDRTTGIIERVSVDSAGNQAIDLSGSGSDFPAISADG